MSPKPVILLVPGSFHKPAHYDLITGPLCERGYTVLTPALATCGDVDVDPSATHFDDAKKIHADLLPVLDAGHSVVVMSHSYGSLAACAAVEGQTRLERTAKDLQGGVVGMINMAGFAFPARGKNVMGGDEPAEVVPYQVLKDGLLTLKPEARDVFYSDVPPQQADEALALTCRYQSRKSFTTFPQFVESEIAVPKVFLLCEKDAAVPPAAQEMFAGVGRYDKVVRFDSGHSPFLTMPEKVVAEVVKFCDEIAA